MSSFAKKALAQLARRVWVDPTADAEKKQLARGLLLLLEGKLP